MTFNNRLSCSIVAFTEMAKRRNKNKAKRRLAAIVNKRETGALGAEKVQGQDAENEENIESDEKKKNSLEVSDNSAVTEKDIPFGEVTENVENICDVNSKSKGRKPNILKETDDPKMEQNVELEEPEETLIFPREIAGETCLDVECGTNEALLYLSKLCLGSKGSCILYKDKWLTPNEFQSVSGRETAKDWKRSIRHKGKSLKLLITKGLIEMNSASPKKPSKKAESPTTENAVDEKATNLVADKADDDSSTEIDTVASINVVQAKSSHRLFKKAVKGRRGRKAKKLKQKQPLKQNVALVRPLQKIVEEANTDSPLDEITKDVPRDLEKDTQITDAKAGTNEAVVDSEPMADCRTTEPDSKIESVTSMAETTGDDKDTRTDEEKRLDEFVKSLRLTKTANVSGVTIKTAPELTAIEEKKEEVMHDDPEDSEMPVLQKEPSIDPVVRRADTVSSNVDPLQAAVTPPPTPPSENPLIKKVIEDDREVETFKARLSSPSNGLKLTINREKVKPTCETEEIVSNLDVKHNSLPVKEQNIQAMLLQDALQSARKYKEQLQQSKQYPSVPSSHARKQNAFVNNMVASSSPTPVISKTTQEFTKPAFINGARNVQLHGITSPSSVSSKPQHHGQGHTRVTPDHRPERTRSVPGHSHSKGQTTSSKSGTPSMNDVMNMMPHLYGSFPFSTDGRDSALAALQAFQMKDKMSTLGAHHAASQANLLHPVITQQLLMAMTQQLYSMYNIPQQQQQQQQHSKSPAREERPSQNSKTQEIRQRHSDKHIENSVDLVNKKRKHSAVTDNSDGVLDLSVKKPKTDIAEVRCNTSTNSVDAPIDFSLKRKTERSEPKYSVHYKSSPGSVRHSFPSDYKYAERYTQSEKSEEKRFPVGCTCKSSSALDDITTWSVDKVCSFLTCLDGCASYAKTFREQGITGRLLPYLTTQHLTRTLGMKVGPALTLMHAVKMKFREQMTKQTCTYCRTRLTQSIHV